MASLRIAILGGTGELGTGLANRWARAGLSVILGSRDPAKAASAAASLAAETGGQVTGTSLTEATSAADVVVVAVPWASHDETLALVAPFTAGRIIVNAVVPLVPPKVSAVTLPEGGSAAMRAKSLLPEDARLTSAFHNVGAQKLKDGGPVDCDVLVFGDDKAAKDTVVALADQIGARGIDGGPLVNSVAGEAMTSVLIGINRRHKLPGAGIRITGLG